MQQLRTNSIYYYHQEHSLSDVTLQLLNNINNNKFNEWNEREEMNRHVYVVSPLVMCTKIVLYKSNTMSV